MRRRAQSTLEYCIVFAIIAASLIGMHTYMKRALQGRFRVHAEELSESAFYSPMATTANSIIIINTVEGSSIVGNTTISDATIDQSIVRNEDILSFLDEPARW